MGIEMEDVKLVKIALYIAVLYFHPGHNANYWRPVPL